MWHAGETGELHTGFGWEPERKRPFGRPRLRWKDIIKMDLQEVEGEALTELIWWALANAVLNLQVP